MAASTTKKFTVLYIAEGSARQLPGQPLPQLPALLLRHPDDVRAHPPAAAGQVHGTIR